MLKRMRIAVIIKNMMSQTRMKRLTRRVKSKFRKKSGSQNKRRGKSKI